MVEEKFNSITNVLSVDQPYRPRNHIRANNINQDESQEIKCWFCSDDHNLGSCDQSLYLGKENLLKKENFAKTV